MSESQIIVLGRIVAPYGVRGWLRIHPYGDDPLAWRAMKSWRLSAQAEAAAEHWSAYALDELKLHSGAVVAKFAGVDDRTQAEALQGWYVGALRDEMPQTRQGEFYWADLIGMAVVNAGGEPLGRVASLIETGANDVLVVEDGERERLLPFVESVVLNVDQAARVVRVEWGADW